MALSKPLLPADLSLDAARLSAEDLHAAFGYFSRLAMEATGIDRQWTPTEIVKVGEAIARKFASRLGPNGRISITPAELKAVLREVIGEIFPAHIAMLMKGLIEKGEASFKIEVDPQSVPDIKIQVVREEEVPGAFSDETIPEGAIEMSFASAHSLLRRIVRPDGESKYGI